MPDIFSTRSADNFRLMQSKSITSSDDAGTYNIFRVPRYAFVFGVAIEIIGAMHADTLIDVGIIMGSTSDADILVDQTAVTPETEAIELFDEAYHFSSGPGVITTTLNWNSQTPAGSYRVWARYSVIA
jgi:hypothetical protein